MNKIRIKMLGNIILIKLYGNEKTRAKLEKLGNDYVNRYALIHNPFVESRLKNVKEPYVALTFSDTQCAVQFEEDLLKLDLKVRTLKMGELK